MKRSYFLKSFGAAIVGLAFTPFVGTAKSQADLDTEEVQSIIDNGGVLFGRTFRINRPLFVRGDALFTIKHCKFIFESNVYAPCMTIGESNPRSLIAGCSFEGENIHYTGEGKRYIPKWRGA